MKSNFTGLIDDPRPKKEKLKDWKAEELASSKVVEWKEKKNWKSYSVRNQLSTSSCVAQSIAKGFEVANDFEANEKVIFSASPIYAKRLNKPNEGMWLQDALSIAVKSGTTLEHRIQSQNLKSDKEIEKEALKWDGEDDWIATVYGADSYATIQNKDIETIAGHLQDKRAVYILIYANKDEWTKYPEIKQKDLKLEKAPIRHAVCVVDFGLIKGKKYLKIEDSAHFNNEHTRFVSEEFLKARCYDAGVLFDRSNSLQTPPLKKHKFTKILEYGMTNNKEVIALQNALKYEGFFPKSAESTGNYFEVTRQAVEKFQSKYKVASITELLFVKGKRVGQKTLDKLNELYS